MCSPEDQSLGTPFRVLLDSCLRERGQLDAGPDGETVRGPAQDVLQVFWGDLVIGYIGDVVGNLDRFDYPMLDGGEAVLDSLEGVPSPATGGVEEFAELLLFFDAMMCYS